MNIRGNSILLVLLYAFAFAGFDVNGSSYDYTASIECLAKPHKPQYRGGIIVNPELNLGVKGWSTFGNAKIQHRESEGNKFVVAHGRNQQPDSILQKTYLERSKLYTFSAWIQVSSSSAPVSAIFKTSSGFAHFGATTRNFYFTDKISLSAKSLSQRKNLISKR